MAQPDCPSRRQGDLPEPNLSPLCVGWKCRSRTAEEPPVPATVNDPLSHSIASLSLILAQSGPPIAQQKRGARSRYLTRSVGVDGRRRRPLLTPSQESPGRGYPGKPPSQWTTELPEAQGLRSSRRLEGRQLDRGGARCAEASAVPSRGCFQGPDWQIVLVAGAVALGGSVFQLRNLPGCAAAAIASALC